MGLMCQCLRPIYVDPLSQYSTEQYMRVISSNLNRCVRVTKESSLEISMFQHKFEGTVCKHISLL